MEIVENEKKSFFARLKSGLAKTRAGIGGGIDTVIGGHGRIDDDFYEELLETLVVGDVGIRTSEAIIDGLRRQIREKHIKDVADCRSLLIENIKAQMTTKADGMTAPAAPTVILVVGVNGSGKTTTVGKLAALHGGQGRRVIVAAADTFRAAAAPQLATWVERAGAELISAAPGADPASVVHDAISACRARGADVLICDTAGRLHNKKNLMAELEKINRIIERELPAAARETLLVLDGTTGQNALVQAREFAKVANISGLVLTKLDGTAKGGIAIAIQAEMDIAVRYIGVGEQLADLQPFDPDTFVEALFTP